MNLFSCWNCISPFHAIEVPCPVDVPVTLYLKLMCLCCPLWSMMCITTMFPGGENMLYLICIFISAWLSDQVKPQKWWVMLCESLCSVHVYRCERLTRLCFHNRRANFTKTPSGDFQYTKLMWLKAYYYVF